MCKGKLGGVLKQQQDTIQRPRLIAPIHNLHKNSSIPYEIQTDFQNRLKILVMNRVSLDETYVELIDNLNEKIE